MQRKPQSSIIMLIVIVAVLLAVASSIALLALQNRPDTPEEQVAEGGQVASDTQIVNVEGVDVTVRRTADIIMLPAGIQPEGAGAEQPAQEAQPTVEQPVIVQPVEPTPTPLVAPVVAPTVETQPAQATAVPVNTVNRSVNAIIFQAYTVQASDSLYNITRQYATSITLMAVNGVSQDDLVAGTTIQIPVGNPAYCPGLNPYAVGEGDTIFSIAQRRNTTKENLRAINGLDENYTIFSGTILCVP